MPVITRKVKYSIKFAALNNSGPIAQTVRAADS